MDPSINKSFCFLFWMIWSNFWAQSSLDLFSLKSALKSWDIPTQNTQLLDKLQCMESVWLHNMVWLHSLGLVSNVFKVWRRLLNIQWTPPPRKRKANRLNIITQRTMLLQHLEKCWSINPIALILLNSLCSGSLIYLWPMIWRKLRSRMNSSQRIFLKIQLLFLVQTVKI